MLSMELDEQVTFQALDVIMVKRGARLQPVSKPERK